MSDPNLRSIAFYMGQPFVTVSRVADRYMSKVAGGKTARVQLIQDGFRTIPQGQVYDSMIVIPGNSRAAYSEALKVMRQFGPQLATMSLSEAATFVDKKVYEVTGKAPKWHNWSMPD